MSPHLPLKKQVFGTLLFVVMALPINAKTGNDKIYDAGPSVQNINTGWAKLQCTPEFSVPESFGSLCISIDTTEPVSYRIRELDQQWIAVGNNGNIIIHRLPEGRYTIDLRYTSTGMTQSATIGVQKTASGQTGLFIFGILGASLLLAFFKWPARGLGAHQNRYIPAMLTDNAGFQENTPLPGRSSDINNTQFLTLMFHDIRSHLVFLEKVCHQIYQSEKTQNPTIAKAMGEIRSTSVTLCGFAESFTPWMLTKEKKIHVQQSSIVMADLLTDLERMYRSMAEFRNNNIRICIEGNPLLKNDERLIRIIIRNLIDNANKNTRNGEITITVWKEDGTTNLTVKDSGKGLSETQVANLNTMFANKGKAEPNGSGLGLIMIADLIRLTNGTCSVHSNGGACFSLSFKDLA